MRMATHSRRWAVRRKVYTGLHMLDALLDEARALSLDPVRRAWAAGPCLIRRLVR